MELIRKHTIACFSNPGVESFQLLNPENSASERVTITRVVVQPGAVQPRHAHDGSEQIWVGIRGNGVLLLDNGQEAKFTAGDVVRFADRDIHGLRNDSGEGFEYISVTSPPINFRRAYSKT